LVFAPDYDVAVSEHELGRRVAVTLGGLHDVYFVFLELALHMSPEKLGHMLLGCSIFELVPPQIPFCNRNRAEAISE